MVQLKNQPCAEITDAAKDNLPREKLVEKVGSFISELLEPIS